MKIVHRISTLKKKHLRRYYFWQFRHFKQHKLSAILDATRHHITALDYTSPLIVTHANYAYVEFLDNWLCAMERIGIDIKKQCLLVALDKKTHCHIQEKNLDSILCDLDIFPTLIKRRIILTFRARFNSLLADMGIDFINSDVDAIWLKNPLPYLARHNNYDLLTSQGIIYPGKAFKKWGFTLAYGFFLVKSTKQTRQFLKEAASQTTYTGDDQQWFNRVLLESNLDWQINDTCTYTYTDAPSDKNALLCSDTIIRGQSQDLRVGLLPFKQFSMTSKAPTSDTYVYHARAPTIASKKKIFKSMNCWFLE